MPYFNWNDTKNLISKATPRRAWNAARVWSSYRLSRLLGKPIQWGYPISISFEPTTSCNLRCPECPSGLRAFTRPTGMLEKDFFRRTIDDIYKELTYLVFYFQGEPYLNPDFLEMVQYASGVRLMLWCNSNSSNNRISRCSPRGARVWRKGGLICRPLAAMVTSTRLNERENIHY